MCDLEKIMDNNSFLGNNPGAVRYGNFINYYSFHPPEYRISSIFDDIWKGGDALILDIGCNSGDLTQKLYEYLQSTKAQALGSEECSNVASNCFILGLDIDAILIKRARESNKFPNNVFYECSDIMSDDCDLKVLEIMQKFNKKSFDAILCFSISMWIHLNNGDEGLKKFINKICSWTDCVIIEPQPWKCYTSAVKRLKKAGGSFPFSPFSDLALARNVEVGINDIFNTNKFVKDFETIPSNWSRKTYLYRRQNC
ncbi:hypothetical protein R5R35_010156 [Gryllus longicercus]|uniref:RNA methyltransferase n=1 Tax=Gryllus longicercus TaxID=2509291 RepID=A0AAN9VC04_9ORTH